jgi:hypothetical protein
MPELIWLYLTALLYDRTSASCVALAEGLQTVSHDRLTRMLPADWSGHTLLESVCRMLFVWERGYLILDDTVSQAGCDRDGRPGVGLFQPGAPAGVGLLAGAAGVDEWGRAGPAGGPALA